MWGKGLSSYNTLDSETVDIPGAREAQQYGNILDSNLYIAGL